VFWPSLARELEHLEHAGLLREPKAVERAKPGEVLLGGQSVVALCSNDYLGLADNSELVAAAQRALEEHGVGASSSRLIAGTTALHEAAERALAHFVGAEAALLFSSGYAANLGALQALATSEDVVFSDSLNHASIIDGCRLSRARVLIYRHADLDDLKRLLAQARSGSRRAIVVSEAVFSMDGDTAPLTELRALCDEYDAALVVDEAHALGVLGPRGAGACAMAGVQPDALIGTLGKAFGVAGGFVSGRAPLRRLLQTRARSFVYTTALPPHLAAAVRASVALVEHADGARRAVLGHAAVLRKRLRAAGYEVPDGSSAIVPVITHSVGRTIGVSRGLLDAGVLVPAIRPPTVPEGAARLRVAPSAAHTPEQIELAVQAFEKLATA
jgi:8-amino-7-oxononanoate synthase